MRFAPLALGAALFLTLFFGLDTVGYLDVHEARDAEVAEELVTSREVLTPLYAHEAFFDRPLAAYLPEVLTHDRDHESPVASRLVRAVLASLLVLLTGAIGRRHFGRRAGALAAMVLVSTLVLPLAARFDAAQLLGTLGAWIAVAVFAHALFRLDRAKAVSRRLASARLAGAHLALAVAGLCAGPMPALWPLGGAALYARLASRRDALKSVRPIAALVTIAGLGLVWYGPMAERHGAVFLGRAPFFPYGAGPAGPWYAGALLTVSLLVASAFPWSALLPSAFAHAALRWRRSEGEEREERASHFFIACLVVALAPIAFYPSPPITAALPAAPAVALLCGRFLDHLIEDPPRLRGVFASASLMLGIVGTTVAIAFSLAGNRLGTLFPALRWLAPFALLSGWAPFVTHFFLRRTTAAAVLIALPVVLGVPLVATRLLPELENFLSARQVAEAMNAVSPARAPLAVRDEPPPSLRLYLARQPVRIDRLETLPALAAGDGYAYLAFRPAREKETAVSLGAPLEVLLRTPTLVLARTPVAAPAPAAAPADSAASRRPTRR